MSHKIKTNEVSPSFAVRKKRNITAQQAKAMLAKNGLMVLKDEEKKY